MRAADYLRRWAGAFAADPRAALRASTGAVGDYAAWRATQRGDRTPLTDGVPWIPFAARRFLDRNVPMGASVFEYGTGGSTISFARRGGSVVSVEHDPRWLEAVRAALAEGGLSSRVDLRLVPPETAAGGGDPADPADYRSSSPELAGRTFRAYAAVVDAFPEGAFDVVCIDGRARPSCLDHAWSRVRPGGLLVLDDSDRPHYAPAAARLRGWERHDWYGPAPYLALFFRTTVWRRPQP